MAISALAKKFLRGLGHHLEPVLNVGKEGVDAGVIRATASALETHELIKIKINANFSGGDRSEVAEQLAEAAQAEVIQTIGRVALLYRARKEKPTIVLPANSQKLKRLLQKPR